MGNVFVLAEHRQGALRDITLEMLALAPGLAKDFGGEVEVLLLGSGVDALAEKLSGYGVKVLVVDDPLLADYNSDKYQKVLSALIDQRKPSLVMVGHTAQGVDMAPALAVEKDLPFVADVIDLKLEEGVLKATRQLYSGKVNATIAFKPADTYLVTVREAAFEAPDPSAAGSIEKIDSPLKEDLDYRKFVEYIEAEVGDVDITQSEVLVAIGRGLREDKNLPIIEELANTIKADLCGSRAAVDAGWLPHDRQVGTSGKSVKPKLYIALGISGAFQHVAGIKGAKTVVAVNKDPEAPIFAHADYAIVDDLLKIVPKLTEKLKELKG
ncbi:MAG TPA: electron transfer flavoprotein subunit alpha/FixB family protein [Bacillota bacterium]|jgi:electron transfer flavoprotein alpha subunit|nr:electron transfer flavoprotein subunit alpha/FixB family protein [Bacillota bacterium]HOB87357.1 electron transfer flavoprotein subunit alpha/FixB family protein [Bacillota bacterium]HOP68489.1 electron transfer flavoprotein subunit alpha/FixB family protein [Bacillota bacterium]HPT33282.1 electron transfer flavoprotein subunit alpha/FixB family protein [Bacillota bacterium]HPZ65241.1 electron transfer flavoprotein subunit alpha/FixB family protein [Bacillota bacterium]